MAAYKWTLPTPAQQALADWVNQPDFQLPEEEDMASLVFAFMAERQATLEEVKANDKVRRDTQKVRYDRGVSGRDDTGLISWCRMFTARRLTKISRENANCAADLAGLYLLSAKPASRADTLSAKGVQLRIRPVIEP